MDAKALVEAAEAEPLLAHRVAPVRAAIDAAAAALDRYDAPDAGELRARVMLRLASVKMAQLDLEGAEQALAAVSRHAPDARPLLFLAGVRSCRVALRRGQQDEADDTLRALVAQLRGFDDGHPLWQAVAAETALGIGELLVDRLADAAARELQPLRDLLAETDDAPPLSADIRYTAHQLLATVELARGEAQPAAHHLRAAVTIARDAGSPADEIESRLALAACLVGLDEPIALEEAARNTDLARTRAKDLGGTHGSLARAAQLAHAGVLSHQGKTAAALDRVLELARTAATDNDVPAYVGAVSVMAELYARSGDHVAAFRTIAEARHALAKATGSDATPLFREALARLRDQVGEDRLEQIAADVAKANAIAAQILNEKA